MYDKRLKKQDSIINVGVARPKGRATPNIYYRAIFCSICTAFRCLHRIWDRPEKLRIILGLSTRQEQAYFLKNDFLFLMNSPNSQVAEELPAD